MTPRRSIALGIDAPLTAVLGAALVTRLAAVLWLSDTIPYSDYFYYHEAARLQAQDASFFFRADTVTQYGKLNWWPPGYPLFLAAIYGVVGPQFRAAVFVQVLLGVAVVALVAAVGERAAGRRAGLAAAWLVALDPTYIFTTNLIASENLYAVWFALGLWQVGRPPSTARSAIWAGAAFGLGALTRASGLLVPFVVAAWWWRRDGSSARARALLAGCALVIAPWTVRNAAVAGTPVLLCFGGGLNFYFGHNEEPPGYRELSTTPLAGLRSAAEIDRRGWQLGLEHLGAHPVQFIHRGVAKVGALFAPPTYALHANSAILIPDAQADPRLAPVAAAKRARQAIKDRWLHGLLAWLAALHTYVLAAGSVAALGAARCGRRMPDEVRLALWIAVAWIGLHVLFWAQPRFRYPLDIPMAILAAWVLSIVPARRRPARERAS